MKSSKNPIFFFDEKSAKECYPCPCIKQIHKFLYSLKTCLYVGRGAWEWCRQQKEQITNTRPHLRRIEEPNIHLSYIVVCGYDENLSISYDLFKQWIKYDSVNNVQLSKLKSKINGINVDKDLLVEVDLDNPLSYLKCTHGFQKYYEENHDIFSSWELHLEDDLRRLEIEVVKRGDDRIIKGVYIRLYYENYLHSSFYLLVHKLQGEIEDLKRESQSAKEEYFEVEDNYGSLGEPDNRADFLPFEDARAWVRQLEINSKEEWDMFTRSVYFPRKIPKNPETFYVNDGWEGFENWLK